MLESGFFVFKTRVAEITKDLNTEIQCQRCLYKTQNRISELLINGFFLALNVPSQRLVELVECSP